MSTTVEHRNFIFEQTCRLLAGKLANTQATPKSVIEGQFKETYEALMKEYEKGYV